jgi:hypothetical protein
MLSLLADYAYLGWLHVVVRIHGLFACAGYAGRLAESGLAKLK